MGNGVFRARGYKSAAGDQSGQLRSTNGPIVSTNVGYAPFPAAVWAASLRYAASPPHALNRTTRRLGWALGGGISTPRGRRAWFVLGGVALVLGVSLVLQYGVVPDRVFPFERVGRPRGGGLATVRLLLPLATSFLGSSLIEVMRYAFYQERRVIQAQGEQLTTELKFLKSQINPHFLFNSLNNIYTLTLLKDDLAAESLLRLSDMLRYMLYDAETPTVPLRWEIAYIRNYVSLRALKDSRGQNVTCDLGESRRTSCGSASPT